MTANPPARTPQRHTLGRRSGTGRPVGQDHPNGAGVHGPTVRIPMARPGQGAGRRRQGRSPRRGAARRRPASAASGSWVAITTIAPRAASARSAATIALPVGGVEVAGRLVGQQHLGPRGVRAGERDPLLLATGQLLDEVVPGLLETDQRERLVGPAVRVVGLDARSTAAGQRRSRPRSATRPARCPAGPSPRPCRPPAPGRRRAAVERTRPRRAPARQPAPTAAWTCRPGGPGHREQAARPQSQGSAASATRSPYADGAGLGPPVDHAVVLLDRPGRRT